MCPLFNTSQSSPKALQSYDCSGCVCDRYIFFLCFKLCQRNLHLGPAACTDQTNVCRECGCPNRGHRWQSVGLGRAPQPSTGRNVCPVRGDCSMPIQAQVACNPCLRGPASAAATSILKMTSASIHFITFPVTPCLVFRWVILTTWGPGWTGIT